MSYGFVSEWLLQGGPILVVTKLVILVGSIGALIIAIERALFMRGFSARAQELHETVIRALLRNDAAQAAGECNRSLVPAASIYRAALDRVGRPDKIPDAVDRARREVVQALRSPLWMLATVGAVMPFVGLFGTVVGILGSFRAMAASGTGGFAVVASGISEALITTAGGIAVAVEAVVFYNFFQARVSGEAFSLSLRADELTEIAIEKAPELREKQAAAAQGSPAPQGAPRAAEA
jgi:biopolymer transport protein ExbB